MSRISVIGGPGSGKSTTAQRLSSALGVPHVELDALWWGPSWTPVDIDVFRARVASRVGEDAWVIEGYYLVEAARPLVWPAADVIVWLDLPRHVSVRRALLRSAVRVITRRELWGTNRQSARVLTPASITRFVRRWPTYPSQIAAALASDDRSARKVVRLRSDGDVDRWLAAQGPRLR